MKHPKVFCALLALLFIVFAPSYSALAQSHCTVNGKDVPCGEVGTFLGVGFGILLLIIVLGILATVFWIMMLVHAISKPIENKPVWIIIILLFHFIGALVYYFSVKRKFSAQTAPPQSTK